MQPTKISNRQLTLLRKLNQKKYREQEQLFLLEGDRAVQQLLDNNKVAVKALFFDEPQEYWQQKEWQKYLKINDWYVISESQFKDVTDTYNPQGVVALCQMPAESTVSDFANQHGVLVALDAVQDPGNAGTIIRSAAWFGSAGLISGKGTVDLFHPKVVRSTAGATGTLPHVKGDLPDLLNEFKNEGWTIYLLEASEGSSILSGLQTTSKSIIVVGNEARGIAAELLQADYHKVRISAASGGSSVESLNAGIAASIAMYELT